MSQLDYAAAAVWLDFDAPTDPPSAHEVVCDVCWLVRSSALDECPNCWGNF